MLANELASKRLQILISQRIIMRLLVLRKATVVILKKVYHMLTCEHCFLLMYFFISFSVYFD